jgi:hypothetical protein
VRHFDQWNYRKTTWLWGVRRLPQIATLNAIANYFNHKIWKDYKADRIKNGPAKEQAKKVKYKFSLKNLSIPGVVIVVAGFYFFGTTKGKVRNAESASFSFRKNTSNDIPNTVHSRSVVREFGT